MMLYRILRSVLVPVHVPVGSTWHEYPACSAHQHEYPSTLVLDVSSPRPDPGSWLRSLIDAVERSRPNPPATIDFQIRSVDTERGVQISHSLAAFMKKLGSVHVHCSE
jgi:hypothetical protein